MNSSQEYHKKNNTKKKQIQCCSHSLLVDTVDNLIIRQKLADSRLYIYNI